MTRADLVWAAAFALAARNHPLYRFVEHPDGSADSIELTPREIREYCEREAERAVAVLGAA